MTNRYKNHKNAIPRYFTKNSFTQIINEAKHNNLYKNMQSQCSRKLSGTCFTKQMKTAFENSFYKLSETRIENSNDVRINCIV